jgi:Ca2+-transporting ATPase
VTFEVALPLPLGRGPGPKAGRSGHPRIPAAARLFEAEELLVDESVITGESQPVEHVPDQQAELKSGTYVVRGRGLALVTAVGAAPTLGRITALVKGAEPPRTPLQKRIGEQARGLLVAPWRSARSCR